MAAVFLTLVCCHYNNSPAKRNPLPESELPNTREVKMNVKIRKYSMDDLEPFYEAVLETIPEGYPWLPWCHPGYTKKEAQGWIAMQPDFWNAGIEYGFLITDEDTGKILGGVGINSIHHLHRFAFLGYWVRSSCVRQGIASTAARQAAAFGFRSLQLNRIEILMAVDNIASRRAAEKAGATYEGIARKKLSLHERFVDAHVFSLLAEDVAAEK
jgi:RimJ/RimL family protein N-acetyltransferase